LCIYCIPDLTLYLLWIILIHYCGIVVLLWLFVVSSYLFVLLFILIVGLIITFVYIAIPHIYCYYTLYWIVITCSHIGNIPTLLPCYLLLHCLGCYLPYGMTLLYVVHYLVTFYFILLLLLVSSPSCCTVYLYYIPGLFTLPHFVCWHCARLFIPWTYLYYCTLPHCVHVGYFITVFICVLRCYYIYLCILLPLISHSPSLPSIICSLVVYCCYCIVTLYCMLLYICCCYLSLLHCCCVICTLPCYCNIIIQVICCYLIYDTLLLHCYLLHCITLLVIYCEVHYIISLVPLLWLLPGCYCIYLPLLLVIPIHCYLFIVIVIGYLFICCLQLLLFGYYCYLLVAIYLFYWLLLCCCYFTGYVWLHTLFGYSTHFSCRLLCLVVLLRITRLYVYLYTLFPLLVVTLLLLLIYIVVPCFVVITYVIYCLDLVLLLVIIPWLDLLYGYLLPL